MITATMTLLGADVTPQQRQQIETDLVEHARTFEPHRLAILARRIRDRLDPDGPPPPEPAPMAGACGELRLRDRRDGGLGLEGWLDAETGTQFRDLIAQFARPRPASETIPDQRSIEGRQADALAELCGLAASARGTPHHGGEPPHLTVTLDIEVLRAAAGAATLDYGQQLTPAQYRRLACDCKLVPVVLGGRRNRWTWASPPQRAAGYPPCIDNPRRRMRIPGMRPTTQQMRLPSRDPLGRLGRDIPRELRSAVPHAPPRSTSHWLGTDHPPRPGRVHPTSDS